MQTYRVKITVSKSGNLMIKKVPFQPGTAVEVTIKAGKRKTASRPSRYPLRGKPIRYVDPFKSVAESDWEALK